MRSSFLFQVSTLAGGLLLLMLWLADWEAIRLKAESTIHWLREHSALKQADPALAEAQNPR